MFNMTEAFKVFQTYECVSACFSSAFTRSSEFLWRSGSPKTQTDERKQNKPVEKNLMKSGIWSK